MEVQTRLSGILLAFLGALTLLLNQATMLYFNSMEGFSVSGGGLADIVGMISFFTGLGIVLYTIFLWHGQ